MSAAPQSTQDTPHAMLARARTFLFVPANRPERIAKAFATGADQIIVDLEDAVVAADKAAARSALRGWLDANPGHRVVVRVNADGTQWHDEDIAACAHPGIAGVMLPKAESGKVMARVHAHSGKALLPIIETVGGLDELAAIAGADGCARLVFGKLDLAVELGLEPDESDPAELAFLPWRAQLVLASKRAGLAQPVDGVFTLIGDSDGLTQYARRARSHGFGAMLLIHAGQVAVVRDTFTPSASERDWARRVCDAAAASGGAAVVDGRMIDAPVLARAQRILASYSGN